MANMTLDELKIAVGEAGAKAVELYGADIIKMTVDDAKLWIQYVFVGDTIAAYKLFLKATNPDALTVLTGLEAKWAAANVKNADKVALQERIADAMAKTMLALVLAMVGL